MKPEKIFEIKGEDFVKGLSLKSDFQLGGIFSSASNFDPFDNYGYFRPSLDATILGTTTATPTVLTSWNDNGTAKIYAHTSNKLYEILDGTPYTETEKSAEIDILEAVTGAIIYKGRYIYAQTGETRSNVLPVASASDVRILNGMGSNEFYHPMCIAPNKLLYQGDFGQINEITSVTSTSGNSLGKYLLEDTMVVRDLINDGTYLVAIADNNNSNKIGSDGARGKYRCQVLFYDVNSGRPTADYIYEFTDSYLISVKQLDGAIYIIGRDNIWVCNSVTAPKSIFSFASGSTITEPPKTPFQVTVKGNSIVWAGQTNGRLYAYGSYVSGTKKVFYQPYSISGTPSSIIWTGSNMYVGSSSANQMLAVLNTGSTRSSVTATVATSFLPQPYSYAFSRVILKSKLTSGGQILLGLGCSDGNGIITDLTTKLFASTNVGDRQTLIFNQENDGSQASEKIFNDFTLTFGGNQAIAKIEVWAYPTENYEQGN